MYTILTVFHAVCVLVVTVLEHSPRISVLAFGLPPGISISTLLLPPRSIIPAIRIPRTLIGDQSSLSKAASEKNTASRLARHPENLSRKKGGDDSRTILGVGECETSERSGYKRDQDENSMKSNCRKGQHNQWRLRWRAHAMQCFQRVFEVRIE